MPNVFELHLCQRSDACLRPVVAPVLRTDLRAIEEIKVWLKGGAPVKP